jgi:hypothetical protein
MKTLVIRNRHSGGKTAINPIEEEDTEEESGESEEESNESSDSEE